MFPLASLQAAERKSGDVIWHDKGEDAPQLTNAGAKPYRTVVIELKNSGSTTCMPGWKSSARM